MSFSTFAGGRFAVMRSMFASRTTKPMPCVIWRYLAQGRHASVRHRRLRLQSLSREFHGDDLAGFSCSPYRHRAIPLQNHVVCKWRCQLNGGKKHNRNAHDTNPAIEILWSFMI